MEIMVNRRTKTDNSTISDLSTDNGYKCVVLEDKDRGLIDAMTVEQITEKKILGKTAIPSGKYEIIVNFSNRFQRLMPLLLNVKGFQGIRVHSGNVATDTEGCLIVGKNEANIPDEILNSREVFNELFPLIQQGVNSGKVFITISDTHNLEP